jgi:phosphatidate cytidylyltransferase
MDANLSLRIGTALIGVPALIGLVGWGAPWMFAAVLFALTLAALREFFVMAFPQRPRKQLCGVLFGLALGGTIFFEQELSGAVWLGMLFLVAFSGYLLTPGELAERLHGLLLTMLGGVYVGLLFPHWLLLFRGPDGRAWTLWLLSVVMIGDSAAYFTGRRFGAQKLAPRISPGKTIAGAWGYLGGAAVAGVGGAAVLFDRFNWPEILVLSVLIGVLGQLGDLFESWLKRVFAVKDSGHLLPGHGGLLDRLDSLIFPAVFTSAYLRVFQP